MRLKPLFLYSNSEGYRFNTIRPSHEVCNTVRFHKLSAVRGCRAGRHIQLQRARRYAINRGPDRDAIPVITGNRPVSNSCRRNTVTSHPDENIDAVCCDPIVRPKAKLVSVSRTIIDVVQRTLSVSGNHDTLTRTSTAVSSPSLYLLNAAALSKPGAVEHLTSDLKSYGSDVAIITETHFKSKHTDSAVSVDGYILFRRDRVKRRGGGVAIYARSELQPTVWTYSQDDRSIELLWIVVGMNIIGAMYHPPKPVYLPEALLSYLELNLEELCNDYPAATIILCGDFNQLSDVTVCERTGLISLVHQPTRGEHILDRIYVSSPVNYVIRVVTSVVKSDHRAVVAYTTRNQCTQVKTSTKSVYRQKSPSQHAAFFQHAVTVNFHQNESDENVQSQFDSFYTVAYNLLEMFYPERTVTITSRDPPYITGYIKSMLRRKNRLMRKGRVEEASALAMRIGKEITRSTKTQLSLIQGKVDSREMWACVRRLTGKKSHDDRVEGISADSLNDHYCEISTDHKYVAPLIKQTVRNSAENYITEYKIFGILDKLRPTATGLDGLPVWFLRTGAPVFCQPLTHLFNLSLSTSKVPSQWKQAWIRPVPKVAVPTQHTDFRPISITPVLTRIMERTVVQSFIYPTIQQPSESLTFDDQFAFRPNGSTTAAIITILHKVTHLLVNNPYVIVIAIDFSKAFDTVRHSTLLAKMAQLDISDCAYNWLVDFFNGHSHQTKYGEQISTLKPISASIIQGSAIGPASYVVNASDLQAITDGNTLWKYADDTYLIIPAVNVDSRSAELHNVNDWALANNLKLNLAKSQEIIFTDQRRKSKHPEPDEIPLLQRVRIIKILGVTFTSTLSVTLHVQNVIASCAQTLYAIRVLRQHGLCDNSLHTVFRAVVVAKLLYASSAWWGFTNATDRQKIIAFIRRSIRIGFCSPDLTDIYQFYNSADDQLFKKILAYPDHILRILLPPPTVLNYNLRNRRHNRQLPDRISRLTDCNFITRMLYHDVY